MMEQTKIHKALQGVRGRAAVDLAALEQLLVNFSRLVIEQPRVKEIDINPLLVSSERIVDLDARVVLFPGDIPDSGLPRPAIRPYPLQYVGRWVMKDGTPVLVRPIRPEDEPLLVNFHGTLSDATVRLRYFHPIKLSQRVSHERLSRICFNDYDRELALVAERRDPATGECAILGIARFSKLPGTREAEFGILISDAWQRRGLGRLLQIARDEHVSKLSADILGDNAEMQQLTQKLGFHVTRRVDSNAARAELHL
jgi:acetyltransferase